MFFLLIITYGCSVLSVCSCMSIYTVYNFFFLLAISCSDDTVIASGTFVDLQYITGQFRSANHPVRHLVIRYRYLRNTHFPFLSFTDIFLKIWTFVFNYFHSRFSIYTLIFCFGNIHCTDLIWFTCCNFQLGEVTVRSECPTIYPPTLLTRHFWRNITLSSRHILFVQNHNVVLGSRLFFILWKIMYGDLFSLLFQQPKTALLYSFRLKTRWKGVETPLFFRQSGYYL